MRPCLEGKCPHNAQYWRECEIHCAGHVMDEQKEAETEPEPETEA